MYVFSDVEINDTAQEEEKNSPTHPRLASQASTFSIIYLYIGYNIDLRLDIRSPAITIYTMSRCVYIVDIYILVKTEERERSCQRSTTSQPAHPAPGLLVLLLFCDVLLCSDVI